MEVGVYDAVYPGGEDAGQPAENDPQHLGIMPGEPVLERPPAKPPKASNHEEEPYRSSFGQQLEVFVVGMSRFAQGDIIPAHTMHIGAEPGPQQGKLVDQL